MNRDLVAGVGKRLVKQIADELDGAEQIADFLVGGRKPVAALTSQANRFLFEMLGSTGAARIAKIAKLTEHLTVRLKAVADEHKVTSVPKVLGFRSDKHFSDFIAARLNEMTLRDDSLREFSEGSAGRLNAFLGKLFEFPVKHGEVSKHIQEMSLNVWAQQNKEIVAELAKKAGKFHMNDAQGNAVPVKSKFSGLLKAFSFDIETADGNKESLDFGHVSVNSEGLINVPLPVEIKLPRAASGVAAQFLSFPERIAAAIAAKLKVIGYFSADQAEELGKLHGVDNVGQPQVVDGHNVVAVKLDPAKFVFSAKQDLDYMSFNRVLVRPDGRYWNPADPRKMQLSMPSQVFALGKYNRKDVSMEISSSEKGAGFIYWRMQVPVERRFLVDIYRAIFEAGSR